MKKVIPLVGAFDITSHLDLSNKNTVVLVRTPRDVDSISASLLSYGDAILKLSDVGFKSCGGGAVYISTPEDFILHYNLSLLRFNAPICLSDIAFVAIDIDEYLLTEALESKVFPLTGLDNKSHKETTNNLLVATLNTLSKAAQSESPFYKDYSFDKLTGFTFGSNFYEETQKTWISLSPENKGFKDNEGYYMFLSIVVNFVEALHKTHPDTQYTIGANKRVIWNGGVSVMPFPLQQIVEARHGLPLSSIEPISIQASMFMMLREAPQLLVVSATPELYTKQFERVYRLGSVQLFDSKVKLPTKTEYFVSDSIMAASLSSRASRTTEKILVFLGDAEVVDGEWGDNVLFVTSKPSLADINAFSLGSTVSLVFWDTPRTDIEQQSIIRKATLSYKCASVEFHVSPSNSALGVLESHNANAYLMASQSEFNIVARLFSRRKIKSALTSFQYDNRITSVNTWISTSELQSSLFYHYEKKRLALMKIYDISDNDLLAMFYNGKGAIDASSLRNRLHIQLLQELSVSSFYRTALSIVDPLNKSLAKNIWEPSNVIKQALQ